MMAETVEYRDGSVVLKGYLAYDDQTANKMPGVLVMPEAFGLGVNAKRRADRLAALGYVALAGDPYGNGFETADLQEAMKLSTALLTADPAKFPATVKRAIGKEPPAREDWRAWGESSATKSPARRDATVRLGPDPEELRQLLRES